MPHPHAKPDFRRNRHPKIDWIELSTQQVNDLKSYVPKSYFSDRTRDRAGQTDGDRLLAAVGTAFSLNGIYEPVVTAFGPIGQDAEAIAAAARNLLARIKCADKVARYEIDEYAENQILSLSGTARDCINKGESFSIALMPEMAREIAKRKIEIEHSLLDSVWELVSDLEVAAAAVSKSLPIDRNIRPERMNSDRLAGWLVTSIGSALNRVPPRAPWFCSLISHAGTMRGMKIGKATTLKHIDNYAAPTRSQAKRAGYILKG